MARIIEHSSADRGPYDNGHDRTRIALSRDELLLLAELPGRQVVVESIYGDVVVEHDTYVAPQASPPEQLATARWKRLDPRIFETQADEAVTGDV